MGWGEGWGGEKCCALSFILAAHKGSKIKTQAWRGKKNPKFNWPGNRIPGASAFSASREGFRQGHFPALGMKKKIKFGFGLDTNCMPGIQLLCILPVLSGRGRRRREGGQDIEEGAKSKNNLLFSYGGRNCFVSLTVQNVSGGHCVVTRLFFFFFKVS